MKHLYRFVLGACLALCACGGDSAPESGASDAAVIQTSGPLLPFKQGNTWTYKVTGDGEVSQKVTTVGAAEKVGGTGPHAAETAFKVVTKKGANDQTLSWQALDGDRVVRFREQAFHESTGELEEEEHWDPAKLHIDGSAAHIAKDASWLESYQETKLPVGEASSTETARDRWTVDAVDQVITVPAGTFKAIVFIKAGGSTLKTYWYVPGVGKVKETGGQTEELVSYKVVP
ncbi:MAG: hypothetical protein RLZZ450_2164 [Pseudomonadota bacterium]|jgi:hypothetical protein